MSRRSALVTFVGALLFAVGTPALASAPVVAVFDVQIDGPDLESVDTRRLADIIASRLPFAGAYEVVPRSALRARLRAEKGDTYRDCYDEPCQLEIGKALAADKALSAKVIRLGRVCIVALKLYDLRDATAGLGATEEGGCSLEAILDATRLAVDRLVGPPQAPPPPKPEPLTDNDVLGVLRKNRGHIKTCIERSRSSKETVSGTMKVKVEIDPSGQVEDAEVEPERFARAEVGRCILSAVRLWKFPSFGGEPMNIDFPVVIRPGH